MTSTATQLDETATTFLFHLRATGIVSYAALAAGISTQALYKRRAKDEQFAAAWDSTLEQARVFIAETLRRGATDMERAKTLLGEVADRLRNPELSPDDRATHMRHLEALGQRIDELKALATSEAAKAYARRRDEARAKLRKEYQDAEAVAAEFDDAIKAVEPAWKRLREALAAVRRTAIAAEIEAPDVVLENMMRLGLHWGAPEFAAFLNVQRPDKRHQQPFARFVSQRIPAEVQR